MDSKIFDNAILNIYQKENENYHPNLAENEPTTYMGDIGYIFVVDGYVPKEYHHYLDDLPPVVEYIKFGEGSEFNKINYRGQNDLERLVPHFYPVKDYPVHYLRLQQMISLGFHVTKIKKVLSFHQSYWLRPYIELLMEKRRKAKKEGQNALQEMIKLLLNSIYGSLLMNERKFCKSFLVSDMDTYQNVLLEGNIKVRNLISNDLMFIQTKKENMITRPTLDAACVLDISKFIIYRRWYNIKKQYGDNIRLLQMDTDSLIYKITGVDYRKQIEESIAGEASHRDEPSGNVHLNHDLSNFPENHPCYDKRRAGFFELTKIEYPNDPIIVFVGLVAKVYAFITKSNHETLVAKGIPSHKRKKNFTLDFYYRIAINKTGARGQSVKYNSIDTVLHKYEKITKSHEKQFTNCLNLKRITFADNFYSHALGNQEQIFTLVSIDEMKQYWIENRHKQISNIVYFNPYIVSFFKAIVLLKRIVKTFKFKKKDVPIYQLTY